MWIKPVAEARLKAEAEANSAVEEEVIEPAEVPSEE